MNIHKLPSMIGDAFGLIGNIIRLSKADQKLIGAARKSWVSEPTQRAVHPQELRPPL